MKKGEIFKGKKRGKDAARHPIVYLEDSANGCFIGVVLTHSRKQDNVPMKKEYFKESTGDKKYEFTFDETFFVGKLFIKPQEWGPFTKIGVLSEGGIKFIEFVTKGCSPIFWDEYLNQ